MKARPGYDSVLEKCTLTIMCPRCNLPHELLLENPVVWDRNKTCPTLDQIFVGKDCGPFRVTAGTIVYENGERLELPTLS